MKSIIEKNKELYSYDNINDYLEYLTTTPKDPKRYNSSEDNGKDFTGTESFDEAVDRCRYGDQESANEVKALQNKINDLQDTIMTIRQTYENSVQGFIPNVPNHLMGLPTSMIHSTRVTQKSKIVNIVINLSASGGVSKDSIQERAVLYASSVDALEKQGYRCNVWVSVTATRDSYYAVNFVKVKSDNQPMNLYMMSFPMSNPSFFRRLGFRWIELLKKDLTGDGYGKPNTDEYKIKQYAKEMLGQDVFVLNVTEGGMTLVDVVNNLKQKGVITDGI